MSDYTNERKKWLDQELEKLLEASNSYRQKALIVGLRDLLEEEETRLIQTQGELEGQLWSKEEWDI